MTKIISLLALLFPLSGFTNDNAFFFNLNFAISSEDQEINVNVRNPSDVQGLSLQDSNTLELGYQFIINPKFGADLSLVSRYSGSGESDNLLNDIFSIFDCFFGLLCDDDEQLAFKSAKFNPAGIKLVPFYQSGDFHFGAGAVFYAKEKLKINYKDNTSENISFDSAAGAIIKSSYYFNSWLALTLTYEDINFKTKSSITDTNGNNINKIDGSNLSIGLKARF